MKGPRHRCWMRAISLLVLMMGPCMADDFLYVHATPRGQRSEIHWVPTKAPLSARVLVEDQGGNAYVYRHRGELWWWNTSRPVVADLVGQYADRLNEFGNSGFSDMVRQGDMLYWINGRQLGSYRLSTGEREVLLSEIVWFGGLGIHEDRLYFGSGASVQTTRLDGTDRRSLGPVDLDFQRLRGARDLVVQDGRVLWLAGKALVQVDLETGERSLVATGPAGNTIGTAHGMAVTDEAIYWVDGRIVWRWRHGANEHEPLYELGDTRMGAITAVSAFPRQLLVGDKRRFQVLGEDDELYQLLYSEDLRSWSPDFVQRSLFTGRGVLRWLDPQVGVTGEFTKWQPDADGRQAYFSAWQYDLEAAYDADGDELPDYWERRHFGDLSARPSGDTNGDGIAHMEEARLMLSPRDVDSDGDGLTDSEELAFDPPLNAGSNDTDGDTLTDGDEVRLYGSDPHSIDTDADGFTDEFEVAYGGDPNERTVRPSSGPALADYADDLMVHFDFEPSEGALVPNRGVLGGSGRIVGETSFVFRESSSGEMSTALEFSDNRRNSENPSYVQSDFTLADIGLSEPAKGFTIALWLRVRTASSHSGTIFSASRAGGPEQAMSLEIEPTTFSPAFDLNLWFEGPLWSSSARGSADIPIDVWTHVSWVQRADRRMVYINGVQSSSRDVIRNGLLEEFPTLWLGAQQGIERATVPFDGSMDDVRVYRQALPANVIKLLAR